MNSACLTKFALASCIAVAGQASIAATLYQQNFDTDTASTATTLATYGLTQGGVASAIVNSGQLRLSPFGQQGSIDFGAFLGDVVVSFVTTIIGGPGSINVGLSVVDNSYVFHPTYPNGAFRVNGPGGAGNQDMGFTPTGDLSQVTVSINATTQLTSILIVNGQNSYQTAFTDTNYSAGLTKLGFSTGGGGIAIFDNVLVTDGLAPMIPEPNALAMFLVGLSIVHLVVRRVPLQSKKRTSKTPGDEA